MTTARAIHIARHMLKANATPTDTFHGTLNADRTAALETLLAIACREVFKPRPDGSLRIPRD